MKALICGTMLISLLCLADVAEVSAQSEDRGGIGGIIDWIHKLSGPPFIGGGLVPFYEFNDGEFVLRLTVVLRKSIMESKAGLSDDVNFAMLTIQPTAEFAIGDGAVGLGLAAHRFAGDATPFWHVSLPVLAQWRPRNNDDVVPRVGVALNFFPPFRPTDFAPFQQVDVRRDGWELVLQTFAGADYRKH